MEEPPLRQPLPPGEDEEEGEEEEEEEADAEWSFVDREMEAVALRDLPTATIACRLDPRVFQDGPCRRIRNLGFWLNKNRAEDLFSMPRESGIGDFG